MKRISIAGIFGCAAVLCGCGGGGSSSNTSNGTNGAPSNQLVGTYTLTKIVANGVTINCPSVPVSIGDSVIEACYANQRVVFAAQGSYTLYITDPTGSPDESGTYQYVSAAGTMQTDNTYNTSIAHVEQYNVAAVGNTISLTPTSANNDATTIPFGQTWTFTNNAQ